MMIRLFDFLLALFGLIVLLPVLLIIYIILLASGLPPLFIQSRIGKSGKLFRLIKFRTMLPSAPASSSTHFVSQDLVTPVGRILRSSKLDELPQLINVVKGDMSLVGPRPCLPSQAEVINARKLAQVWDTKPGITGLSQILDITMQYPDELAKFDAKMQKGFSSRMYFVYVFATLIPAIGLKVKQSVSRSGLE